MPSIVRSILAVVGGIAVFSGALFAMGPITPGSDATTNHQLMWLALVIVSMIAGGFTAAWIALRAGATHALVMAVLQAAMTFVAMLTVRTASEPIWFWLAGIVLMPPAAWAGARLRSAWRPA